MDSDPRRARIGLVLGAGGTVGGAFHAGVLAGLAEATGWDPRSAAVIVGTSVGSITGTGLRAGLSASDLFARSHDAPLSPEGRRILARAESGPRSFQRPERTGSRFRPPSDVAAMLGRALVRPRATRSTALIAGLLPDGAVDTSMISNGIVGLTEGGWPADPLWICAVRQSDARRVVLGRSYRPDLSTAVAASCAIPGFFQPVEIEGETYIDGGVHSPSNADVLVGEEVDLVIVLSPMSISGRGMRLSGDQAVRLWSRARLDGEARRLRRGGQQIIAFQPTAADADVMSGNALDPSKRAPVARQARESTLARLERSDVADRISLLR